ncbi:iron complex transport system ATP-binding protein [Sporobacter termitidis DSM 10068]|uniref:Iron complex transport system ATP-binding protein n=1 Tax=Sporobacter termitidis DSM 10068 TaxID=1123282 RepID=A0A1M5Z5W6_9FIRM|nr:ABC transporter ATP-binding protein [Sporobacter termitidis]SHI19283.1 iron complex transport system ATP-binding protein [Sporobacter termitidis DSM 10068]
MSVTVNDLSFSYKERRVLADVSFTARTGELLAVLGPNGVGKSTLFQCILGLLPYTEGEILLDGLDAKKLDIKETARRVAYIPQSHAPAFNFSVFDIILMGTSAQISDVNVPKKRQLELAEQSMERLGITHLKERGYLQISGGERQLVLIARALAQDARILVMDEPTSNLDYGNQLRILSQIKLLAREGYTVVLSTHSPDQAFMFADRVLALQGGRVVRHGRPFEVITDALIKDLYNVEVEIQSLYGGKARMCLPKSVIDT